MRSSSGWILQTPASCVRKGRSKAIEAFTGGHLAKGATTRKQVGGMQVGGAVASWYSHHQLTLGPLYLIPCLGLLL